MSEYDYSWCWWTEPATKIAIGMRGFAFGWLFAFLFHKSVTDSWWWDVAILIGLGLTANAMDALVWMQNKKSASNPVL